MRRLNRIERENAGGGRMAEENARTGGLLAEENARTQRQERELLLGERLEHALDAGTR